MDDSSNGEGDNLLKHPAFPIVLAVVVSGFFIFPTLIDYLFYQRALPYQAYVLEHTTYYTGRSNETPHYMLTIQYQPPHCPVFQENLESDEDHKPGEIIPIDYDPNLPSSCRAFKTMTFQGDVLPTLLVTFFAVGAIILRAILRRS